MVDVTHPLPRVRVCTRMVYIYIRVEYYALVIRVSILSLSLSFLHFLSLSLSFKGGSRGVRKGIRTDLAVYAGV